MRLINSGEKRASAKNILSGEIFPTSA